MTAAITLSQAKIQTDITRTAPRPQALRDENYAAGFDWKQLFYDIYRVGPDVVLQGPPMYGLIEELQQAMPFSAAFKWPFRKASYFGDKKRGEIWLRSEEQHLNFSSSLGDFNLAVQPNESHRFKGHRVLLTLSKDNEIRWIIDWIRFHQKLHDATAVLFYDNNSQLYSASQLEDELRAAIPDMEILVVSWPYIYGPQAGPSFAVNGIEPDWDSDYCQVGVLQHARFRFLQSARSVMHNDIDELVISKEGRSVFEAAEQSRTGMVKFDGRWISVASAMPVSQADCRHADFYFDEGPHIENSPPKWCIRPQAFRRSISWGVHNIFGAKGNAKTSSEFLFRHFRGITTSWKYQRWAEETPELTSLPCDTALQSGFIAAGLKPGYSNTRMVP